MVPCRFAGDIKSAEGLKLTDEYHNKYLKALQTLWETNKHKVAKEGTEFQVVE